MDFKPLKKNKPADKEPWNKYKIQNCQQTRQYVMFLFTVIRYVLFTVLYFMLLFYCFEPARTSLASETLEGTASSTPFSFESRRQMKAKIMHANIRSQTDLY